MIDYLYLDETQIGTTTPGQSKPERNDNERLLHIPVIASDAI